MNTTKNRRQGRRHSPWRMLQVACWCIVSVVVLSSVPGQAAMRILAVADLARQADVIVMGTVQQQESAWDERHTAIHTDVVLAVERVLAGTAGERVTLRVDGGIVGSMGMRTSNDATFTKAERVLVLLDTSVTPSRIVGLQQGKFTLHDQQATRVDETWELDTLIATIQNAAR